MKDFLERMIKMPVYKDKKRGTWYIVTRYKDWTGKLRTTTKRGFKTKMDAKNYEIHYSQNKQLLKRNSFPILRIRNYVTLHLKMSSIGKMK